MEIEISLAEIAALGVAVAAGPALHESGVVNRTWGRRRSDHMGSGHRGVLGEGHVNHMPV
jgi:hypothetical protein